MSRLPVLLLLLPALGCSSEPAAPAASVPFTPQFTQQFTPQFTPPVTPFMHTNPALPWIDRTMTPYNYNSPFFTPYANPTLFTPPITPFMQTNPALPWLDRTMTPYNYNFPLPYFQGYRPFGL